MGRYIYVANIIEDLMKKVLEYAAEVEHAFMDEYKETTEEELIQDFIEYIKK